MKKLAVDDSILLSVDKPARYIGSELNSVVKDKNKIDIRFAMCFPDVYEIGMSHLGIQILYDMFNRREDVWCERVYSPWTDMDRVMREKNIRLFALESQDPILDFDFLGITIQYEMCYTNILQILDLSGIPLHAQDRSDNCPIVIGGGPCAFNPEPLAPFFDMFYIGEGETQYNTLFDLYRKMKKEGKTRQEFLRQASHIPGIYVPSLYQVSYNEDGTLRQFMPLYDDVPARVKKQIVMDLTDAVYPEKPVVPYIKATQDRVVLEVQRGCIRGCRFCQAGMIYRPTRQRNVKVLEKHADSMLKSTGYEEINLSSLSTSDYTQLSGLVDYLIEKYGKEHINIALPSLRIDAFSLDIMSKVQDVRKSSLTFAPEAGSQRLRNIINKGLTEEDILGGAAQAFRGGWSHVKLYFMLGLPQENDDDRRDIAHLANKIAAVFYEEVPKEERHGKCQITVSTSFFVPKPFTPFQWAVMYSPGDYLGFAATVNHEIKAQLNHKSIKYNWHQAEETVLEGFLARGDRRCASVIEKVYRSGQIFDAWTECFHYENWLNAFDETGVDPDFYTKRPRSLDELLPWDFIDIGVSREFLKREWQHAMEGKVTPNCREQCSGCGARVFGGGVCYEGQI